MKEADFPRERKAYPIKTGKKIFYTLFYISYNLGSLVNLVLFFSRGANPVILSLDLELVLGELERQSTKLYEDTWVLARLPHMISRLQYVSIYV